jgi:hypothetical protein
MGDPLWGKCGFATKRTPLKKRGQFEAVDQNAPEEIFGEVSLFLVVILGIVLAINFALVALHIG